MSLPETAFHLCRIGWLYGEDAAYPVAVVGAKMHQEHQMIILTEYALNWGFTSTHGTKKSLLICTNV